MIKINNLREDVTFLLFDIYVLFALVWGLNHTWFCMEPVILIPVKQNLDENSEHGGSESVCVGERTDEWGRERWHTLTPQGQKCLLAEPFQTLLLCVSLPLAIHLYFKQ